MHQYLGGNFQSCWKNTGGRPISLRRTCLADLCQVREEGMNQSADEEEHAGSFMNANGHPDPTKPCAHLK